MMGVIQFLSSSKYILYVGICPKNSGYDTVIDFSSHKPTSKIILKIISVKDLTEY